MDLAITPVTTIVASELTFCEQFCNDIIAIITEIWNVFLYILCCCRAPEPEPIPLLLPVAPPPQFPVFIFDQEQPETMKQQIRTILGFSSISSDEIFEFLVFAKSKLPNTIHFSEGYAEVSQSRLFKIYIVDSSPVYFSCLNNWWNDHKENSAFSLIPYPRQGWFAINPSSSRT